MSLHVPGKASGFIVASNVIPTISACKTGHMKKIVGECKLKLVLFSFSFTGYSLGSDQQK